MWRLTADRRPADRRNGSAIQGTAPAQPGWAMGTAVYGASIPDLLSPFQARFGGRWQEHGELPSVVLRSGATLFGPIPGRPKAKRWGDIFVHGCAKLPHRPLGGGHECRQGDEIDSTASGE